MIHLEAIEKVYRTDRIETVALSNVNLDIQEGEFVSVMGPSGCGKSTLLNLIGLLDVPTKGQVALGGIRALPMNRPKDDKGDDQGWTPLFNGENTDGWTINGKPGDSRKIDQLVNAFRSLVTDEFVDPPEAEDLSSWSLKSPSRRVTLTSASGQTFDYGFGKTVTAHTIPLSSFAPSAETVGPPVVIATGPFDTGHRAAWPPWG